MLSLVNDGPAGVSESALRDNHNHPQVYLARLRGSKQRVVVKQLSLQFLSPAEKQRTRREADLMLNAHNHPNVVRPRPSVRPSLCSPPRTASTSTPRRGTNASPAPSG